MFKKLFHVICFRESVIFIILGMKLRQNNFNINISNTNLSYFSSKPVRKMETPYENAYKCKAKSQREGTLIWDAKIKFLNTMKFQNSKITTKNANILYNTNQK